MPPDYRTPSPDAGHEALRAPLAQAIDDLAATVADLANTKATGSANRAGVDDAYFLTDLLFDLLGSALTQLDTQATQIADLTARLAVLEPAVFTTPPAP